MTKAAKTNRFVNNAFLAAALFICTLFVSVFMIGVQTAQAKEQIVINPYGDEESYELPDKPYEPRVTKLNTSSVTLKWDDRYYTRAEGYEISEYNASTKKYTVIGTTKSKSYKITGLKTASKHSYAVRGYRIIYGKKYYGSYSTRCNLSTSPNAATLNKVSYSSKGKMKVSWKKVSGVSGYMIQYSTSSKFPSGGATCNYAVSKEGTTSVTIGGLATKTYYVRVCAYKQVDGKKYCSKWSKSKKVAVKKGLTLKEMLNYTKTDLSGRKAIKELTDNGVDIKKYNSTYARIKAIYDWHSKHAKEFSSCAACNGNFNSCISSLYKNSKKQYDQFIYLAEGDFKNSNGKKVMHKWPVIYVSGVKYIIDPRMQGYTGNYKGTTYFGVASGSKLGKRYLFDRYYITWNSAERENIIKYS